jgi:hypothetical protein
MCVDKPAAGVASFAVLAAEAAAAGPPWSIVFTAALSGQSGQLPSAERADTALRRMVAAIEAGRLEGLLPFNRRGEPVQLA